MNLLLGSLQTPATWIRNFIRSHPAYKHDSVVSEEINHDLMVAVDEMYVDSSVCHSAVVLMWRISERGVRRAPELLPEDYTGSSHDKGSIGL